MGRKFRSLRVPYPRILGTTYQEVMVRILFRAALATTLALAACGGGDDDDRPMPGRVFGDAAADAGSPSSAGEPDTPRAPHEGAPPVATRPADSPATGPAGADVPFEGTAGPTDRRATITGVSTQTAVRVGRQQGFDRIVFEFGAGGLPGYTIEYVDRPIRQCGSGNAVAIAGNAWLRVGMTPARAHDDAGNATVTERALSPGLPAVRALRLTCDFEARLEWVIGVAAPNRYRVLELRSPDRLVVDILH